MGAYIYRGPDSPRIGCVSLRTDEALEIIGGEPEGKILKTQWMN